METKDTPHARYTYVKIEDVQVEDRWKTGHICVPPKDLFIFWPCGVLNQCCRFCVPLQPYSSVPYPCDVKIRPLAPQCHSCTCEACQCESCCHMEFLDVSSHNCGLLRRGDLSLHRVPLLPSASVTMMMGHRWAGGTMTRSWGP